MHQRIPDLIHHGTIQLGLLTGHIQFHLLVQLLRQITDHSGELHYNAFDRYHSYLHYGFMQIGCHIFQIFDLLIECRIVAMVIAGSSYQRVFGNDQLTYEIHQRIQFLDVYTYSTVDHRLAHLFFLRSFSSRRLLLFFSRFSLCLGYFFFFLLCGFLCLLFGMIILGLLQFQNRTGHLCDLGYAFRCLDHIIQRIIGQNDQSEIFIELFVFHILCAGYGDDDLSFFLHSLEHQESSCRLQDTAVLYHNINTVYIFALFHSFFDHADLAVIKRNAIPFFRTCSGALRCGCCCFFFLCGLLLSGLVSVQNIIQGFDQIFIVIGSLIGGLLNVVFILLQSVQALEQYVDHFRCHLNIAVTHFRKYIFHIMGQILHPLIAHGSRHTLQGMCRTEYFIDIIHILGI